LSPAKKLSEVKNNLAEGVSRAREIQIVRREQPIESLLADAAARQEAIDTLMACLKAERTYYDLYSKSMVTEPDYSTRCAAAKTLLAYDVGEPVKRQQIIVTNVESMDDVQKKLAASPAMREEFRRMIVEAEENATARNTP
jgi:hypothetical protein